MVKLFFIFQQQKEFSPIDLSFYKYQPLSNFTIFGTGLLQEKRSLDWSAYSPIAQFAVIYILIPAIPHFYIL
jgi:hypothetical protein